MNQKTIFSKYDILYFLTLALLLAIPSRIEPAFFLQIHQPLTVESHKNFPPYIAHQEISLNDDKDLDSANFNQTIELSTLSFKEDIEILELSDARTMVLDEVSLFKSEMATYEIPDVLIEPEIVTPQGESIVEPETKAMFSQTGILGTIPTQNSEPNSENNSGRYPEPIVEPTPNPESNVTGTQKRNGPLELIGTINIQQGLGLTNEHSLEIRRIKEGVLLELGTVNVQAATYTIKVSDIGGQIRGRILDRNGQVLGEGLGRINSPGLNGTGVKTGPKLVLVPIEGVHGSYYSQYDAGKKKPLSGATVRFLQGSEEAAQDADLQTRESRLGPGSTTVLNVESPKDFSISSKIVFAGEKFDLPVLPVKMVKALREMVSDQRQQDLNDPNGTLIWGQVKIDGLPLSGVTVEIESSPDILPIYLNEYFLPDSKLKATSTNGYFAFLQVEPGFHSLLALRGDKYFSHENVIVDRGSVTISEIKNTVASKQAKVRTYDCFSGLPRDASLELQSVDQQIQTSFGQATILLPAFNRMSLINVNPEKTFLNAVYQYNDINDFVDIPLIQASWIHQLKAMLKINSIPDRGTIVGFVSDENFEAYSAIEDKGIVTVYFDRQGNVLDQRHGVAGGGFVLFNVPIGSNEAIIFGDRTQKLYSQVIPVDSASTNVLIFKSGF